jgi:hypothetical protein
MDKMEWVDKKEAQVKDGGDYFNIVEGDNRFQVLSHLAPQALRWTGTKYEPAEEGDTGISIKGVGWVLHEGTIKLAKLPYTVVKAVRALQSDEETRFESFPMPYMINVKAKGAGTKEVEYTVIAGRSDSLVSKDVLAELAKKPTPEEMVEKMKNKVSQAKVHTPDDLTDEAPF